MPVPNLYSNHFRFSPYLQSGTKLSFDLLITLCLLPIGCVLMFCTGLVVWLIDGKPIIYTQWRIGQRGQKFRLPKIRTMTSVQGKDKSRPSLGNTACITNLGHFLRRYRLDEWPQLFCVLKGQMSLVGPRPELPELVATYQNTHRRRLWVRPGLTGLWQVRADRARPIHHDLKYDLYYLRHGSCWLDLKLLWLTIGFILSPASISQKKKKIQSYENRLPIDHLSVTH